MHVLDVAMGVAHLGTTSMRTTFAVTRGAHPIVEGEMRHVFIDLATRGKTPIPDWLRAGLERYAV